jgi:hypothetical protein
MSPEVKEMTSKIKKCDVNLKRHYEMTKHVLRVGHIVTILFFKIGFQLLFVYIDNIEIYDGVILYTKGGHI